jgi:hypothetical protein
MWVMPSFSVPQLQMKGKFKSMLNSSAGSVSRRNSAAAAVAAAAANPEGDGALPQSGGLATNPLFDDPSRNNPLYSSSGGGVEIQADASSRGGVPDTAGSSRQNDGSYFADESLPVIQSQPRQVQKQLPFRVCSPLMVEPLPSHSTCACNADDFQMHMIELRHPCTTAAAKPAEPAAAAAANLPAAATAAGRHAPQHWQQRAAATANVCTSSGDLQQFLRGIIRRSSEWCPQFSRSNAATSRCNPFQH